ncbi:MAG TPA: amino acid adenylation domain-containing protein, partial [Vicinamibacteria bacterium]|nr:amino acid adenylation domain-containing protein [Vicinamibacteria bacterium]
LVARVRETALGAYAHQELPFEKLVEETNPERSASHHPLFQVAFALQNAPQESLQLSGLQVSAQEMEGGRAKFDLTLVLREGGDGLVAALAANSDLFEAATLDQMLEHYTRCLAAAVAAPDTRLSALGLLDARERRQLVEGWNQTASDYPRAAGLQALFSAQAARTPDAVAASFGAERLSYRELDRRSNQLARRLHRLGVGLESRVGLCLERSAALPVATLGILKAGAAYLPLDPSYPQERLAFMLRDGAVDVVVTQEALRARLPPHGPTLVSLDGERSAIEAEGDAAFDAGAGGGHLAYVIYTSGSTGEPKGVCVPHGAVGRLVLNTNYVRLEEHDRVAQASNASFDAATFELWGPLLHGGCVVGLEREVTLRPSDFASELREQRISTLFLTTALFNVLARDAPGAFAGLKTLMFGGEAVDPRWVRAVLSSAPPQRLLHVYGPTETTTFATWHHVRELAASEATVPIGLPLTNTTAYVLDAGMQPVPLGVSGELFLGGDGLARGYWRRPALTAERFLPDPFGSTPGARLYRTGDLVKRRPDGTLEFLGRADHQVKLRGFRIELGEIETALREHAEVRDAAVLLREEPAGGRQLVAYVVGARGGGEGWDGLRDHLRRRLPEYMVPAAFVALPALPLTPNGKLDRRSLPAPPSAVERLGDVAAPATEVERTVAAVWREVLGTAAIGIDDSFFDLGGHSLLLIQVHERLARTFPEQRLRVLDLFEHATIRSLAARLDRPAAAVPLALPAADETAKREESRQRLARRRQVQKRGAPGEAADE